MSKRERKWTGVHYLSGTAQTTEAYCPTVWIDEDGSSRPCSRRGWPAVLPTPMVPVAIHPPKAMGGSFERLGSLVLPGCRNCGWRLELVPCARLAEARRRIAVLTAA